MVEREELTASPTGALLIVVGPGGIVLMATAVKLPMSIPTSIVVVQLNMSTG